MVRKLEMRRGRAYLQHGALAIFNWINSHMVGIAVRYIEDGIIIGLDLFRLCHELFRRHIVGHGIRSGSQAEGGNKASPMEEKRYCGSKVLGVEDSSIPTEWIGAKWTLISDRQSESGEKRRHIVLDNANEKEGNKKRRRWLAGNTGHRVTSRRVAYRRVACGACGACGARGTRDPGLAR
jgi:hypothetical protein